MTNGRFSVALEYTKNSISDNLDDFKTFFENTADVSQLFLYEPVHEISNNVAF